MRMLFAVMIDVAELRSSRQASLVESMRCAILYLVAEWQTDHHHGVHLDDSKQMCSVNNDAPATSEIQDDAASNMTAYY